MADNKATSQTEVLERRKLVRVRLRQDLGITPQKYEGKTYYVVKDPVSLRYYRFKEQEHFLLQFMDGRRTLDLAQKEFEKRFRPERLTLEDLEGFAQQLLQAGLAQNESPQAGKLLFDRRKKRMRMEWLQYLTNILYIKIPIFDPDKLLTKMLPWTRWIFTTWFLLLSCAVMGAAVLLVASHFETFREKLPSYHEFFSFKTVAYLWIALGAVKIIHEFGHGLSCKAFGGEVHEMGLLFLVFSPCLYCNVSDSWTLPSKWKRIIISSAGIYVELIIAAIATFVWWNTPNHPFVNNMSLSLMIVCSVSTVVFNANPLMRYDGYYILADWLEIPNLRDRSNRFLKNLTLEYCLGVEVQPEPYMATWRKVMFVFYAVVSWIYRWIITYAILIFMASFLEPYRLKVLSQLLAIGAVASMVGWPAYRLGKNLWRRGRLPDMKSPRVTATVCVLAAVVLGFFLVPLPITSRIRQDGLVQLHAEDATKVYVTVPGVLKKLYVQDGQVVQQGEVLAELSSPELESQVQQAAQQHGLRQRHLDSLGEQKNAARVAEQAKIQSYIESVKSEMARYEDELRGYERMREELVLKAPRAGVVMNPPKPDDVGKKLEKDQQNPFCSVGVAEPGKPCRLRVLVPVAPSEFSLLEEDLRKLQEQGADLPVTIRIQGMMSATWKGKIDRLPEAEAKDVPVQLTSKSGGPIAVKPNTPPGTNVPQAQQYVLSITILNPDAAIHPGTLAKVKIHCQSRSCAWWVWRTINDTFDLGLI